MTELAYIERPPEGPPAGLLLLHHGRGTDERDLVGLGQALDPERRLHIVTPRAPLQLPGSPGRHWYVVPRVGHPDPATFLSAYHQLAELHDHLSASTGIEPARTVLGGFSMGAVMSYALALGADRPAPSGVLAFSGFIPTVEGWQPSLTDRPTVHAFIAHGRGDPVIDVAFARRAREILQQGGLDVEYHESDGGHTIDPADLARARHWLQATLRPIEQARSTR